MLKLKGKSGQGAKKAFIQKGFLTALCALLALLLELEQEMWPIEEF